MKNRLALLAAATLAACAGYEDVFTHSRHFPNNIRKSVPCKSITVKPIVKQEHKFTIKGHTIMASSRKDAIKRLRAKKLL